MSRIQQNTENTNPAPCSTRSPFGQVLQDPISKFPLRPKLVPLRRPPNGQILRRIQKRLIHGDRTPNTFFAEITERQLTAPDEATPSTAKLSILQKRILLVALRWRGKAHADIYTEDVKTQIFNWRAMCRYWDGWQPSIVVQPGTARLSKDHPNMPNWCCHGQIFDRQSIGESRYNTVSVSISRALKRLIKRHLVFRSGAGWSRTDQGAEVARTFIPKPGVQRSEGSASLKRARRYKRPQQYTSEVANEY